jgi:uncharacterized Zn finger protein
MTTVPEHRADRYLDGLPPLLITHLAGDGAAALVTDTRATWRVTMRPDLGWSCTCPAKSNACGHIAAVRKTVVLDTATDAHA